MSISVKDVVASIYGGIDQLAPEAESAARACEIVAQYDGPKGTFLDIGAHHGAVSAFALHAGFQKVVSYEACDWHFEALLKNRDACGDPRWQVHGKAIWWNRDGVVLRRGGNSGQVSAVYRSDRPALQVAASVRLYEDAVKRLGFVDYLKFDIEGAEYPIFFMDPTAKDIWPFVRYVDFERHGTTHELLASGFPRELPGDAEEQMVAMLEGLGLDVIDAMHARGYVQT
jgi:FkbM family methyltransferase